jgi:hypothetical protein
VGGRVSLDTSNRQPQSTDDFQYATTILTMPAIKHPVKINVDLGEGYGNFKCGPDDELIPLIDHANIACGFHAG